MKLNPHPTSRQKLGKLGEDLTTDYLRSKGYQIIQRNFRHGYGELDIVAIFQNTTIFVEVKTRIGEEYGKPEEAVTPRKLHEIVQTAEFYISLHPEMPQAQRIDVVGIELDLENKIKYFNHIISVTS
jgi:putative endonuclease